MVDVGWSQAMWFEGSLLDGDGFRPFFLFPHKRERRIRRRGKVVEWVGYSLQNEVLHIKDHGYL